MAAGNAVAIGWDGTVSDGAATLIAEHLSQQRSRRTVVAEAVARAHRHLPGPFG
ncbi:hypothetical protein AB0O01_00910 [Streptomyces sp. NPDC093252]|uniref:hypothetical protein n=1 Tax=Streptomyces sp. NPDC093252 TaxID=3154980 RepID=UPI0034351805